MNIRTRLLSLVLFAVLAPAIFVAIRVIQDRNADIADATRYVGLVARDIAQGLDGKILGTAQLHYGLVASYALQSRRTAMCSDYLGSVRDAYPQFVSILSAEPDGSISCNSLATAPGAPNSVADRTYFMRALTGDEGPILEPVFGRVSGRAVLQIGFPARYYDRTLRFLAVAGLDLAKFAELDPAEQGMLPGLEVLFLGNDGTVLVWNGPDSAKERAGTNIRETPLFKLAADNPGGVIGELHWDGYDDHVWAAAPRAAERDPEFRILVGIARSTLTSPANRRLAADLTILTIAALFLIFTANMFAEFSVHRPLGRVIQMASRLASGDLAARIAEPLPRGEIGDLMTTMNNAAEAIQTHRAEIVDLDGRLRQSQKMEAIGQLTGGIAHDFNHLLTVILGNSELLKEHLADDPEGFDLATVGESAALRGSDLTKSLLAFARRQSLAPQVTDVNELLSGIFNLLRRSLGERIDCRLALGADLWPAIIDRTQLTTALLNLAVNARDAMMNGGRLTLETANVKFDEIYVEHRHDVRTGDYIMIAVSDSGVGMAPDVLARAIEPFFTTKEVGKGSGLGLSMVYGFVKQSGGHVNIYSEQGRGTTIKLYLPRSDETGQKIMTSENEKAPLGGSERILVVEDDELVRGYVQSQLTRFGYRVHAVTNGLDALEILESDEEIDLLFTDIVMPGGLSGLDIAERGRVLRPGLKILFTSGYTESVVHDDARFGARAHLLNKPYRRTDLAEKLRLALKDD